MISCFLVLVHMSQRMGVILTTPLGVGAGSCGALCGVFTARLDLGNFGHEWHVNLNLDNFPSMNLYIKTY